MNLAIQRDPTSGKYILHVDASLYKVSACSRKVWYTLFRGLRKQGKSHIMDFGTAFHKFAQAHYAGIPLEAAMKIATDYFSTVPVPDGDWRHLGSLVNVIMQYHKQYAGSDLLRAKDSASLEAKFAYPFYQTDKCEVLLCGTIDMIGSYAGRSVIVDHKTTSITGVETYLNSYQLSPQLMMYKFIYEKLFGVDRDIGCLINGVFLGRTGKNTFQRSEIFDFTPSQMHNFEHHLLDTIMKIVSAFESLEEGLEDVAFLQNFTCCDEKYGQCQFTPLCQTDSPDDREMVIANSFTTTEYNPLRFQE